MNAKIFLTILVVAVFAGTLFGGEWSTYNGDNRRSCVSGDVVGVPLFEQWRFVSREAPKPAWPEPAKQDYWHRISKLSPEMTFDRAFKTVAAGGKVYFGSSVDDKVYCLDAKTGKEVWSFFTEGPVRLAPTIAGGKVYVGSDDGAVYCLSAETGELVWKYRAVEEERRLPGNGRIISMWPVRTGVVVEGGTAYFCAGLFPLQKVYLCAVDAGSGAEVWKKEISVSAQGYMLAGGGKLYVPTGRTSPAIFDMKDGASLGGFSTPGGGFALLADDVLINGPGRGSGAIGMSDSTSKANIATFSGLGMVVDGRMAYLHSHEEISALDRVRYRQITEKIGGLKGQLKEVEKSIKAGKTEALTARLRKIRETIGKAQVELGKCVKWRAAVKYPYGLAKAGGVLFAGGDGKVAAISAVDGKEVWSVAVKGKAYGLAISGGKLLVSTDAGEIYCFGGEKVTPGVITPPSAFINWAGGGGSKYILDKSGVSKGYCLLLDIEDAALAYFLALKNDLKVVCVNSDEKAVANMRMMLDLTGLYGRVSVCQWDGERLPFTDYIANLVVCAGDTNLSAKEIYRVARPDGGVVMIDGGDGKGEVAKLKKWAGDVFSNFTTVESPRGVTWGMARRGKLAGAGEWTHMYGDAANTACSMDSRVKGEMTVQWFGEPGPREMVDRHHRNVLPLYKDGRLFAPGDGIVYGVDAYNGTVEWEVRVPNSRRLGVFLDSGSMVVDDENLYVVAEDKCHGVDVETGKRSVTHVMPQLVKGQASEWGYISYDKEMLFGSGRKSGAGYDETSYAADNALWYLSMKLVGSDYLFGMDRKTGKVKWEYKDGLIVTTTITVGDGNIYFVESSSEKAKADKLGRMTLKQMFDGGDQRLVAINGQTGKVIYKKKVDVSKFSEVIYLNYAKGLVLLSGSKKAGNVLDYSFYAISAASGKVKWEKTHGTNLPANGGHGEQNRHPTIVGDVVYGWPYAYDLMTGEKDEEWNFKREGHGCGGVSASAESLFWRGHNPWQYDLGEGGGASAINKVTRPGCWINIIPAGGLVLIPESSSGCTCGYSMQMSIAYVPK